ncbi:MAG: site-specific DNA-methyltransferase, partial [Clostridia bacterium]|nr:site-specific DNA-methyltransferase [Clostridia bacterium]
RICEDVTFVRIMKVINGYGKECGIPANLKYYRTDFVSKDEEYLSDALLEHMTEMIQLEHGVKIDGQQYIIVMDDNEADELAAHWSDYPNAKALYVSKNVLFTTEQNAIFKDVEIHIIPDYYFSFELKEVGESW